MDIKKPLSTLQWVPFAKLKPNSYNPNVVPKENLQLLKQSILTNGWTLPIVVTADFTIIDGFHRWTVAQQEPLVSQLGGMVPVVIVDHKDHTQDMYGTITHNRARGTHVVKPMMNIVKQLLDAGKTLSEIERETGMKPEEVFRLSSFGKEDFLKMMTGEATTFSKAKLYQKL